MLLSIEKTLIFWDIFLNMTYFEGGFLNTYLHKKILQNLF
jgi:hypothetical protein